MYVSNIYVFFCVRFEREMLFKRAEICEVNQEMDYAKRKDRNIHDSVFIVQSGLLKISVRTKELIPPVMIQFNLKVSGYRNS